jgi:hypothetical protein
MALPYVYVAPYFQLPGTFCVGREEEVKRRPIDNLGEVLAAGSVYYVDLVALLGFEALFHHLHCGGEI